MRGTVIVMLKAPVAGRVKTRLGREIGMTTAAWWFRHQTAALLRRIDDPRWRVHLAVAPDRSAHRHVPHWPRHLPRQPQGAGDLGARMLRAMQSVATGPVCVIGGDIPGITPVHLNRAFRALGAQDAIFGPAPDGGYWLVGLRHPHRAPARALQNIRWSSEHALADSRASLGRLRIALTDTLQDIDTAADLRLAASPRHCLNKSVRKHSI